MEPRGMTFFGKGGWRSARMAQREGVTGKLFLFHFRQGPTLAFEHKWNLTSCTFQVDLLPSPPAPLQIT